MRGVQKASGYENTSYNISKIQSFVSITLKMKIQ